MAFRQRTITGTVVDGDGAPIKNGEVKFQPTKALAYTATHIVVDAAFRTQTDDNGNFSIDIWCDEDSLVQVDYNVYFPVSDGGAANTDHRASFSLQYGDGSPVNLAVLINGSIPAPTPDELLYTFVENTVADQLETVSENFLTSSSLKEKAVSLLASVIVSTNIEAKQNLYTVPAGKKCVITAVILKEPNASLAAMNDVFTFGFDNPPFDWGQFSQDRIQMLVSATDASAFSYTDAGTGVWSFKIGAAGNIFAIKFFDTSVTATVGVDVFGYLY